MPPRKQTMSTQFERHKGTMEAISKRSPSPYVFRYMYIRFSISICIFISNLSSLCVCLYIVMSLNSIKKHRSGIIRICRSLGQALPWELWAATATPPWRHHVARSAGSRCRVWIPHMHRLWAGIPCMPGEMTHDPIDTHRSPLNIEIHDLTRKKKNYTIMSSRIQPRYSVHCSQPLWLQPST